MRQACFHKEKRVLFGIMHALRLLVFTGFSFLFSCNNGKVADPSATNADTVVYTERRLTAAPAFPLSPTIITGDSLRPMEVKPLPEVLHSSLRDFDTPLTPPDTVHFGKPKVIVLQRNDQRLSKPVITTPKISPRIECPAASATDKAVANVRYYTVDHGLPGNASQAMLMDHAGRMWIGTDGGVAMFDGYNWELYTSSQGYAKGAVMALHEDKAHNLWIGTYGGGLDMLSADGSTLSHWSVANGISSEYVYDITEDSSGNIWIGTFNGGLNVLNPLFNTIQHFGTDQGLPVNEAWRVTCDRNGRIWLGMQGGGLGIIDPDKYVMQSFSLENRFPNKAVFALEEDAQGRMWVGTNRSGVLVMNYSDTTALQYLKQLTTPDIFSIAHDVNGNVWIGSYRGGVNVIRPQGVVSHYTENEGLTNNSVLAMENDLNGNVWMGTNGGGINFSGNHGGTFKYFGKDQGLDGDYTYALHNDAQGNLWLGTNGGGISVCNPLDLSIRRYWQGLNYTVVQAICSDDSGNVWLGEYGGGVNIINEEKKTMRSFLPENGLTQKVVVSIVKDNFRNTWIATGGGGIVKINAAEDTVFQIRTAHGLCSDFVTALFKDSRGRIWVTTQSGLNIIDPAANTIQLYASYMGLSSDAILALREDNAGNIWIGYDGQGFDVLSPDLMIRNYTERSGLPNNRVQCFYQDENKMWIGTSNGLVCVFPEENFRMMTYGKTDGLQFSDFSMVTPARLGNTMVFALLNGVTTYSPGTPSSATLPSVYVNDVAVSQQRPGWQFILPDSVKTFVSENNIRYNGVSGDYHLPVELVIPFAQNHVTLSYATLAYAQREQTRYRYMLDGLDQDWSEATTETKADYRNLPPGKYTFRVVAQYRDNEWSVPAEFSFEVLPPWWRTAWAYGAYILLFFAAVLGFNRIRTRALRERQKELEHTVMERTAEIAEKQKEIIDSINYAATIQQALLTSESQIAQHLPEFFILYRPKDIVAGDFYWFHAAGEELLIAAADCTGHGVPGAFMSLMGVNFLNEIVIEKKIHPPASILNELRRNIIRSFESSGSDRKDGMDICLVSIAGDRRSLSYAAANNPLWIVREGQLLEFPAQKMPVGKHHGDPVDFVAQHTEIRRGDLIYIFTDGYADQFGGPKGKKFKYRQLQEMLIRNSGLSMQAQKIALESAFDSWKSELEQVDDVLIIGIRV